MYKMKDGARKRHLKCVVALIVMIAGGAVSTRVTALTAKVGTVSQAADKAADQDLSKEQEKALNAVRDTYNVSAQSKIAAQLEEKKKEKDYTLDSMFIKYNPFGTNTQSAYVYFTTDKAMKVSYTVSVSDKSIGDFTQEVKQEKKYQKVHEFEVIGLIPDMENKVRFTIMDENGVEMSKVYAYNMGSLLGEEAIQLQTEVEDKDADELSDGLYAVLGNEGNELNFIYLYDNAGVLRGEIPLLGESGQRLLLGEDTVYYSISDKKIAAVNRIGQVVAVYDMGTYEVQNDYIFDDAGNILMLAADSTQDSVGDVILKLDVASGQVTEVLDLGDILSNYKAGCVKNAEGKLDWIHINTIQWMGNGQILLSSSETSTILKVSDLYGSPKLAYMLGAEAFWNGTGYENLLFAKDGDFAIQGSQHSIVYALDKELKEGQYYLYMFNNNVGNSASRPDFNWAQTGLKKSCTKDGSTSYCYKYLVDETNKSFRLTDSFKLPYTESAGSVQELDGNTIASSGLTGVFGEYDEKHNLIASFKMETEGGIYRVYKYTSQILFDALD